MTDTDAMRRLAAEKFPTGPADLLERLFAMREALTEAASEIERLREALGPFAEMAECYETTIINGVTRSWGDDHPIFRDEGNELTVSDLRRASAALERKE